jgi:hypothetical protein
MSSGGRGAGGGAVGAGPGGAVVATVEVVAGIVTVEGGVVDVVVVGDGGTADVEVLDAVVRWTGMGSDGFGCRSTMTSHNEAAATTSALTEVTSRRRIHPRYFRPMKRQWDLHEGFFISMSQMKGISSSGHERLTIHPQCEDP